METQPPLKGTQPEMMETKPELAGVGRSRFSRRRFLQLAGGTGAAVAVGGVYAWRIEPHWVEVVRRPLPIANLPAALVGKTVVQISDLHQGAVVDFDYLAATLDRISEMKPDLVVITGDFMTFSYMKQQEDVARLLEHLKPGSLGIAAAFGNHDYSQNFRAMEVGDKLDQCLSSLGIHVLRNRAVSLGRLNVIGIDEFWGPNFRPWEIMPKVDPRQANLVLCHNPDAADRPEWHGYQGWILSGHTHGGQVKPPFFPPPILSVTNRRYVAGEYDLGDGRRMYINRGLGYSHRIRFNARPEITVFELTAAGDSKTGAGNSKEGTA